MEKFEETLKWMFKQLPMFQRQGPVALKLDLTRMVDLLKRLGDPHKGLKYIHIAGTNGKGTSAHIIASVLQASGLSVGMYTSPHYKDFRERIKINGSFVEKSFVVDFIAHNKSKFEDLQPSFFELTFLMAVSYFKQQQPDIIILETGMGGRLDSTNVVEPLICLITNIGYDHQQFLGETLEEIAFEKGGIIKPKIPVVIGEFQQETAFVFEQLASELAAPLVYSKDLVELKKQSNHPTVYQVDKIKDQFTTDLQGPFVERNLISAIALLKCLALNYPALYSFDSKSLFKGLSSISSNTYYIGRWFIQSRNPLTIFDSAHNKEGLKETFESVSKMNQGQLHIVFATVADKDMDGILPLFPLDAKYYLTRADIPRAMDVSTLYKRMQESGLQGQKIENSVSALAVAKSTAGEQDCILVVGSIFLIAELL